MRECKVDHKGSIQGFVDSRGTFHTRQEALKIAKQHDQIVLKHPPLDRLLSEDMY